MNLIEPNTLFLDYQHRVDTRVARNFRAGRYQIQGFIDLFNLFNDGTVTAVNETYSSSRYERVDETDGHRDRPHASIRRADDILRG